MKTLAVKYRPSSFSEVVEQGPIKAILQEQVATGTFKNAYLFTGGAGTGKTTCARILAKDINEGKGTPVEIDAASNNGVDNVRDIIDNSRFKAIDAKYKVYIIDECHMLSNGAWNAMLKLLEEPPAFTIFIFCTTDPQKIPATILSRVQRYDFQRLSFDAIVERLRHIIFEERDEQLRERAEQEGRDIDLLEAEADSSEYMVPEEGALEYIAKIADGGMRDAITMLDKVLSYSREITVENVVGALGTVNYDLMVDLANHIIDRQSKEAIGVVEQVYRKGLDLKQFVKQFCEFLLDVRKYQMFKSFEYLKVPQTMQKSMDTFLDVEPEFIRQMLHKFLRINQDIKWETVPKPIIESEVLLLCE